jgi:hypothetical protein
MQTIQNDNFKVSVKETGAELCSFKSLNSGKEYIWQADPDVWAAHAPNPKAAVSSLKIITSLFVLNLQNGVVGY